MIYTTFLSLNTAKVSLNANKNVETNCIVICFIDIVNCYAYERRILSSASANTPKIINGGANAKIDANTSPIEI